MSRLALYTLGLPRLERDGVTVDIRRRRAMALLIYLAVTGCRQSRDTLATLFYPEHDQSQARAGLRRILSTLRKALGEGWLDADLETVCLNPEAVSGASIEQEFWLDVTALRATVEVEGADVGQLEEALSLYRGPFLEGFAMVDSAAYEDWAQRVREELERLALSALERLVTGYEQRGEIEEAIDAARRQVDLAPWQESAHRQLMRLLALGGERSAALAQYKVCCRLLREELDVAPSAETVRLYECIREGGVRLAPLVVPTEPIAAPLRGQESPPLATVDRRRHNLPAQLIPFVGRETVLTEIVARLLDPGCRLLTLVGLGGSGKTRLALEVAGRQIERYSDGVFFVPLAPLQSIEAIVPAIAQAIGFAFYRGRELKDQLLNYLRQKNVFLVLDSMEHLLAEHLAEWVGLISDILQMAPEVKILATSRSGLHVQGEHRFLVSGMSYPVLTDSPLSVELRSVSSPIHRRAVEDESALQVGVALQYDAVRLFTAAAHRARSDFELTDDNVSDVVRICRLVDGLPLALLLAAAWVEVLTPAEIARELAPEVEQSFGSSITDAESGLDLDVLETDLHDAPERQRSMRAVFEHSWGLLAERGRAVLQALSVFRGGCTREAAREIAYASRYDLMALVDRSLLHRTPDGRYEMHKLLQQYVIEKLDRFPEAGKSARDRHCAYYATALVRWAADLKGARQQEVLAEMGDEIENARAAWNWAVVRAWAERVDQAMEGLGLFYQWHLRCEEGEAAFQVAASRLAETSRGLTRRVWIAALSWQGLFTGYLGRTEIARQLLRRSLGLLEGPEFAGQDVRLEKVRVLWVLGWLESWSGTKESAGRLALQSLSLYRVLGDQWGVANTLSLLGYTAQARGQFDEARRSHQEALAIRRMLGDQRGIAESLTEIGITLAYRGQFQEAVRLMQESVAISRGLGDRVFYVIGLARLAGVLLWQGEFTESLVLQEKNLAVLDGLGASHHFAWVRSRMGSIKAHLGQYDKACVHLQRALVSARKAGHLWAIGITLLYLGHIALAAKEYLEAERRLQESVATLRKSGAWSDVGWPLALLAGTARALGRLPEAQEHLCESLQTAAEIRDVITPLCALPVAALLLADGGDTERAVEVYALASRYGFVSNSRLWEDIAGREIDALTVTLPSDVVASVQARGRARDLWTTVEELLADLEG